MLIQKCKYFLVLYSIFINSLVFAQYTIDVNTLLPEKEFENVFVKELYSDSNTTTFIIWVKHDVKSHKHLSHTENIKIIEGTGEMTVGKETFLIKSNDFFIIPQNTFHAVKVTSTTPLKLISIQSPYFNGDDRIFEKN